MCFVLGIVAYEHWRPDAMLAVVLAFVLLVLAYGTRKTRWVFPAVMLAQFVVLGWLCSYGSWLFESDHLYFKRRLTPGHVTLVRGVVTSPIKRTQVIRAVRQGFELQAREIFVDGRWQKCRGRILVNLFRDMPLDYGDFLEIEGKLHRPFNFSSDTKFSYQQYLQRRGIYLVLSVKRTRTVRVIEQGRGQRVLSHLYHWRLAATDLLEKSFSPERAVLMQTILLGQQKRIPEPISEIFARTGTTHILAISGLHVTILVAALFFVLRLVPGPRLMPYGLTIILILGYVLLTGASASVVRAGIMGVVLLTGFVIERESDGVNSLSFAALLLLWINPNHLFGIGFQLSFLSVLAILLFYPVLMSMMRPALKKWKIKALEYCVNSIVVTLSATLGVGGLIAYYFGMITPVAVLANVFAVPLSSVIVILGMGMLISGVFGGYLVPVFVLVINGVLDLLLWMTAICADLPGAFFSIKDINIWQTIGYYLFVVSFWLVCDHWRERSINGSDD